MVSYKNLVEWIAIEEAVADTPASMSFEEALDMVSGYMTTTMVADVCLKHPREVAADIVKVRGFKAPRGFIVVPD